MPQYHFDVSDGDGFHRDEFGDELDSIDAARAQAQSILPDIAREKLPDGELHTVACDMRDQTGRVVYAVELTCRETRSPG